MRTPAREARVVAERLLGPRTRAEAAAFWRVDLEGADMMLLRAGRAFEAALDGRALGPPLEFGIEASQARALAEALDGAPPPAEVAGLAKLLLELGQHREAASAKLRTLQVEAEHSPARRVETWARRAAIALVIGLTLFFYWREQHKTAQPPRFEERTPPRGR